MDSWEFSASKSQLKVEKGTKPYFRSMTCTLYMNGEDC